MNIRKIIKEELLKEVGGYDDMSVMAQHAGVSMGILSSSYQVLMDTLAELANSLIKGEGSDKFKMSKNIVNDLNDITQQVIEDTKKTLKDFTEDDVISHGKGFIRELNKLVKRIRLVSGMVSTYTKEEYEEELKKLLIDFLPKFKEYGDTLIKTNQMFNSRFPQNMGRGNAFFN